MNWEPFAAVGAVFGTVMACVGFTIHLDDDIRSDLDCKDHDALSSVDEAKEGCWRWCKSVPIWWGMGSRESCWWDDEKPEGV